ncbi:hypothetical protein GCM10025771_09150 [Niveibacterium umoris]|uniref:PleD family two-component response regulator n=1 Tax=Niveibacterium umoris TaxID=1193620 RepID=A0A840BRT8_9RHOO|nr:response regulator [Niveibacterium umoris]MBB4013536.1 PleD family two-component response regulator [Niveibacterium umoris]
MKVVIIDEVPINVALMQALCNRLEGCETLCFHNPTEGLAHCVEHQPDLLVVGYAMSGIDGIELIRRFRAVPRNFAVPIVMVSAAQEREVRYLALHSGANEYLTKPIDKNEFLPRIRNLLSIRFYVRQLEEALEAAHVANPYAAAGTLQ